MKTIINYNKQQVLYPLYKAVKGRNRFVLIITSVILFTCLYSCKKDALDIKPNKSLVIPSTLSDFQGILDYVSGINYNAAGLGEIGSDDFYLPFSTWQSLSTATERNTYTWNKDTYGGEIASGDWNINYSKVFSANVVLEGLQKVAVSQSNQQTWNNIKGQALFLRAFIFYQMAQEFAKQYVPGTAASDLGIPLRLGSDPSIKSVRATVADTFTQIVNDLKEAETLLPATPEYKTRSSRPAADALLARIYLIMGNYDQALTYANKCLTDYSTLIDFNALSATNGYPLTLFNDEVIYHSVMGYYGTFFVAIPDSNLYKSFTSNDLRKTIFFDGTGSTFRGNYTGNIALFSGIASDEVYLICAEANARLGNTSAALTNLNALLKNRWVTGTFIPRTAASADDALGQILTERRKELMYRGLRWTDLRRLNLDSRFAVTLTRNLNGQTYTLPPNDLRYTLLIPSDVISISGMQQNPR